MAKLQRKSAKVFAEQAQAAVGGIAQFGSLAAGDIQYSKDVDVIQALDAYKNGWASAVVGNKSPAMEDRNALDYLLSYQQAYIMQHGVPEWLSTETYYTNSYVVDSNGELRVSIIDNNTGHDPIQDNGGQYWGYAGARGSGKQVGEVYFSQSSSANDNKGALPLFTGEVISNADNIYPQFYAWVLAHTSLCKTEAEYQTAISTYGECPFYVIDDTAKTIRLPKLVNYIKMAKVSDGITQSEAGLPNGSIELSNENGAEPGSIASGSANKEGVFTKLSNFNPIFKDSVTTVTPAHTTVFPWVFAFNAAIPASTAQAAEFQTALTGKADVDLTNCTKPHIVETYSNGTSWYRVYSDGWCEQGGVLAKTRTDTVVTVTFLKPFIDANYCIFKNLGSSNDGNPKDPQMSFYDLTATTAKTIQSYVYVNTRWKAEGYIS